MNFHDWIFFKINVYANVDITRWTVGKAKLFCQPRAVFCIARIQIAFRGWPMHTSCHRMLISSLSAFGSRQRALIELITLLIRIVAKKERIKVHAFVL